MSTFRRRLIMSIKNTSRLPETFQEVEYIESTGTQRIVTNFSGNLFVKGIAQYISVSSGTDILFGQTSGGARWFGTFNGKLVNAEFAYEQNPLNEFSFSMDYNFDGLTCSNEMTVDGETNTRTFSSSYSLGNLSIFNALNTTNNQWGYPSTARVKQFRIYDGKSMTNLLGDLIPCYSLTAVTNSEGVQVPSGTKGLYDTVNGVFYTNGGTGVFLKGDDV